MTNVENEIGKQLQKYKKFEKSCPKVLFPQASGIFFLAWPYISRLSQAYEVKKKFFWSTQIFYYFMRIIFYVIKFYALMPQIYYITAQIREMEHDFLNFVYFWICLEMGLKFTSFIFVVLVKAYRTSSNSDFLHF